MRSAFIVCLSLWATSASSAGEAPGKLIYDRWEIAYLGGVRSGHVRTSVVETTQSESKIFAGTVELRLAIKRFNEVLQLGMDSGSEETPEGVVTGVFMKQYLGKAQKLEIRGVVEGKRLKLTITPKQPIESAPWKDGVIGVYRQQRLFQDRKVEPGDQFGYLSFEPSINLVVPTRVLVKEEELVEISPGGPKQKLLRVEIRGDKIQGFQPPPLIVWLDGKREQVKSESEIPGLGKIVLVRATKEQALANVGAIAKMPEIPRMVPLRQRIARPHETKAITYRIRVKDDPAPGDAFSHDGRQKVDKVMGESLELTVRKGVVAQAETIGPEFLKSSYFIASADPKVIDHARRAVGVEKDPWKKALRIEQYVHQRMTPKASEAMATADQVAKTLEGDCTEYAMLMAAMCRAEGISSRTAIGLIYAEERGAPIFAFHMWTEVWNQGQWHALDATLARGGIGAAHLKISDQSWHDEATLAPLLPTLRVLGKLVIEIANVE